MACFENGVKIVVIAEESDTTLERLSFLPAQANVILIGSRLEDFQGEEKVGALEQADVVLNCIGTAPLISQIWPHFKSLKWMHSRFAGVDHLLFPDFVSSSVMLTNARGLFSSSLAEYCMLGALWFAKDVRRLQRNQREGKWEKFVIHELRGATMGILGYGDIGQACARLAKGLGGSCSWTARRAGLTIVGQDWLDQAFGAGQVKEVMAQSDYIVVAAALTPSSLNLVGNEELEAAKPGSIIMNLGRGPIINEEALITALRSVKKTIVGAVLDVFTIEPLPKESPLWSMENVLLSPHNADMTSYFLH
ncbi:unnamed protein product, partial [Heterosigma akashiwo]